ncbi:MULTISPECIES: hypothetical protein [unclassified Acinetobacter]|uniref:hypothetical protein n=1 Tax=unclassified Acinetobacter TaxID=196816 RepID=UPI00244D048F|nr:MULTISPECIES: hypothetical protein [unclassified Acinetobacter]MDH0031614.1 hypothetical protein [Acinetobacter sp. GD04021]MDH0887253.1 hypothetical protein [Acinetobacter sp. GD03873]MDH1083704.1 hypothetical protein [Acinetobacter sp. GD03983]MDH2190552.1 hypothetical protein [Acinetobacter sp. GD03645]MDH2204231.1 hypothetical protein [Acinetobacter sp. GD03647]
MSQQQSYSEYFYFTITQDSEQSVQEISEQYHFDRMWGYEAWNKGQISDDGTHQFQQMCIRFDIDPNLNNAEQIQHWFTYLENKTNMLQLPTSFHRTLHLVTHDVNMQGAGFHLNIDLLRELSELNAGFHLHGYLDQDDRHDYPYAQPIKIIEQSRPCSEYAYFSIVARLPASELQQLFPNLNFEVCFDQGHNIYRPNAVIRPIINHQNSLIKLHSRLDRDSLKLNEHIADVVEQLLPYQDTLQQLFFNPQYSLGVSATGHIENPHHRPVSAANIRKLFTLGLSLDVDYYFA